MVQRACCWLVCLLCACVIANAEAAELRPLTAIDAIRTVRLMPNPESVSKENPAGAISVSPDGKHYVVRLLRGDPDRNVVEMQLISGRIDSFDAVGNHETVARLITPGLGTGDSVFGSVQDTDPYSTSIRWLDNEQIVFLWSNGRGIRQVVRIHLPTRYVEYLTDHPTHVGSFDVGITGVVFYNAQARPPQPTSADLLKEGFVIHDNVDVSSLFRRDLSGGDMFDRAWNTEWFVQERPSAHVQSASHSGPRQIKVMDRDIAFDYRHRINFSPDGLLALINASAGDIPSDWDKYTELDLRSWINDARRNPRASMARGVHQLYLVDIDRGISRPLWNSVSLIYIATTAWSPDGRSVLLAPTYLPPAKADPRGLSGRAAAVVDVATGQYEQLPIELPARQPIAAMRWLSANVVELRERVGATFKQHCFKKIDGQWYAVEDGESSNKFNSPARIEVREDLNVPPKMFAVDVATGAEKMILDLNPTLEDNFHLGRVEKITGTPKSGDAWEGLLFYPPNYRQGHRYPLVIQSQYGAIGTSFTLYGFGGLGPAPIATYPGRVLANRDIVVLHMNVHLAGKFNTPAEAEARKNAFEAVTEHLVASGLVDRRKVGIVGFSRNGYYVEYTLTHSKFPFAAAIAADNWDPSYFQHIVSGDIANAISVNGAPPFGNGLKAWLQNAPGFNADKIHTPLRLIEQSGGLFGVLAKWEIFGRLRYLKRPVEFYVMPNSEQGSHNTQNPAQILAVQQGTVDWFDFWLNGHEDPDPLKAQQYERWSRLRRLHEANLREVSR